MQQPFTDSGVNLVAKLRNFHTLFGGTVGTRSDGEHSSVLCSVGQNKMHCRPLVASPSLKHAILPQLHMAFAVTGAAKPGLLLLRRSDATFSAALRARFRVHDFYASGAALPAFLTAAAAEPDPPRAALVVAGGAILVDAAFLDAVPSLGCVVTTGAGVDHVDLAQCARRGVVVAGAGEIFSVDVAEHAVGLLIGVLRRLAAADRYVRSGLWAAQGDYPLTSKVPSFFFLSIPFLASFSIQFSID